MYRSPFRDPDLSQDEEMMHDPSDKSNFVMPMVGDQPLLSRPPTCDEYYGVPSGEVSGYMAILEWYEVSSFAVGMWSKLAPVYADSLVRRIDPKVLYMFGAYYPEMEEYRRLEHDLLYARSEIESEIVGDEMSALTLGERPEAKFFMRYLEKGRI